MARLAVVSRLYLVQIFLLFFGLGAIVARASAGAISLEEAARRLLCGLVIGTAGLCCVHAITREGIE